MRGISFYINGEYYAADVTLVQKVARKLTVSRVPASPDEVVGITNVNGKAVTILDVGLLIFGTEDKEPRSRSCPGVQVLNAVIFKPFSDGDDRMGFVIDKTGTLLELEDEKISPPKSRHITGVVESGGVLYRIIDVDSVVGRYRGGE